MVKFGLQQKFVQQVGVIGDQLPVNGTFPLNRIEIGLYAFADDRAAAIFILSSAGAVAERYYQDSEYPGIINNLVAGFNVAWF